MEVICKQWKASLMSLWDRYRPERDMCGIRKSLTFCTFPPKPHDLHRILVTFHIWNRGLYPRGICESGTGPNSLIIGPRGVQCESNL